MRMYSSQFFSLELLRGKFEIALEFSRKTQGIQFLKDVTTLSVNDTKDCASLIVAGILFHTVAPEKERDRCLLVVFSRFKQKLPSLAYLVL